MKETHITWTLGAVGVGLGLACTVLNVVFAYSLASVKLLAALRILLFVAFGLNLVAIAALVFFTTAFVQKLHHRTISFNHTSAWQRLGVCAGIITFAACLSGVTLVWLAVRQHELPKHTLRQSSRVLLIVWFTLWGLNAMVLASLVTYIGLWTRKVLKAQSVGQLDLDFGIQAPETEERRASRYSYNSQDPTLHSPPRTPNTRTSSSLRHSSSTKVGPGSSRTKLIAKGSARSSNEYPAGEATNIDAAFDSWDTSSVHREMRYVVHSSPSVGRNVLETIPGSRSVSPADALEGPFLPESPHATSSDAATAVNWEPSSPRNLSSSVPSSPPNFSRPTSRSQNIPFALTTASSMTELIHPLFRPNSPRPPPIAIAGTMVTASPMAGQPITPRTLARMRSNTLPQHWKPLPSPTPSSPGIPSADGSPGPGSPGPSIADDVELPPILPGFVLSAGQRSSLVGYGRRKSTRERPKSAYSQSSRLSMSAM